MSDAVDLPQTQQNDEQPPVVTPKSQDENQQPSVPQDDSVPQVEGVQEELQPNLAVDEAQQEQTPEVEENTREEQEEIHQEPEPKEDEATIQSKALLLSKLSQIGHDTFKIVLPEPSGGTDYMFQEITSSRLATLLAVTQDDLHNTESLIKELSVFDEKIDEINKAVAACDGVVNQISDWHSEFHKALPGLKSTFDDAQKVLEHDKSEITNLQHRIEQARREQDLLQSQMESWKPIISAIQAENDDQRTVLAQIQQETEDNRGVVKQLRSQVEENRRETRKIAEEMGDWAVSAGANQDAFDLDLDHLTVEALDGTAY